MDSYKLTKIKFQKQRYKMKILTTIITLFLTNLAFAQSFYFGADMSYVNEMEDCGAKFHERGIAKSPYEIFENYNCNLVRLRLWNNPNWYQNLNEGKIYSDLDDVKRAIAKAKAHNMSVLLDFQLSDTWADSKKQVVPKNWVNIVDDTERLKDTLYDYIFQTLLELQTENLLPEMVQIGNETNKEILLPKTTDATWKMNWERNAILFNSAITAVRDFEKMFNKKLKIMLHISSPENVEWFINSFIENGVTDFDIIGISYCWAWHKPTSIKATGEVIRNLRATYPKKSVIIVETGYIWTTESNDEAPNIVRETHPDFSPATPINQRDWLIEMTQEVINNGGQGVVYWEPCWVSTSCSTLWGKGSHQEHATFFDFNNNLLIPGGIQFMTHEYDFTKETIEPNNISILTNSFSGEIMIDLKKAEPIMFKIFNEKNQLLQVGNSNNKLTYLRINNMPFGVYKIVIHTKEEKQEKVFKYNDI